MKAILAIVIGLWAGSALAGSALAGDALEGVWKTRPDDNGKYGYVQIKPCGAKFCGTLIKGFDSAGVEGDSPNIGKMIVWDMVAAGGGSYVDGQIWAPDRDKTYASSMQMTGDTLSVSGCVFGGLICRAQDWTRVK